MSAAIRGINYHKSPCGAFDYFLNILSNPLSYYLDYILGSISRITGLAFADWGIGKDA
jgi:hypothetical protein